MTLQASLAVSNFLPEPVLSEGGGQLSLMEGTSSPSRHFKGLEFSVHFYLDPSWLQAPWETSSLHLTLASQGFARFIENIGRLHF